MINNYPILRYQLFALGPAKSKFQSCLDGIPPNSTSGVHQLGIIDALKEFELQDCLEIITDSELPNGINPKGLALGLWFGSCDNPGTTKEIDLAESLIRLKVPFIPIVDDLTDFSRSVPSCLSIFNGVETCVRDEMGQVISDSQDISQVVSTVLRFFGLVPEERKVFISYCRKDSREVANQLFEKLCHKGYMPFLDTASIEKGKHFQKALHDHLNNAECIVFLDTMGTEQSQWCREELISIHQHGIGVLQLVWPGRTALSIQHLNQIIQLNDSDFEQPFNGNGYDKLLDAKVQEIHRALESLRIRSIASRKARILREFLDRVEKKNENLIASQPTHPKIQYVICPAGPVWLYRDGINISWCVWPSPKQPDSALLFVPFDQNNNNPHRRPPSHLPPHGRKDKGHQCKGCPGKTDCRLPCYTQFLFDGTGVLNEKIRHIDWLGEYLPAKSLSLDKIDDFLGKIMFMQ